MTFDEVLERMLARVPNTFDKREGSVIYDAIAPAARELSDCYAELEEKLKNTFAGTANREWLIKRCSEIGVVPAEATYAIRKGIFTPATLEIPIGARFSYDALNFIVTEKIAEGEYKLRCEEVGPAGNYGEGALLPIEYINGLETATLTGEILIYGEDEEDTEVLRKRYFDTLPTMTLDGNVAQYRKWCREFAGIGNYKIFPCWNGRNTVKVSILSSENTKASEELIDSFQTYLDPANNTINDDTTAENYPQDRGLGMGKAPIGAIVTVTTPTVMPISITATVIYRNGYEAPVELEQNIKNHLNSLNYVKSVVSYVAISALFQNDPAIELVVDLNINGAKNNITLADEEISELGTLTVTEA